MKTEKVLLIVGIILLVFAFLRQPMTVETQGESPLFSMFNRPGEIQVKGTAILPENYDKLSLYISRIDIKNGDNQLRPIISGSVKYDLEKLVNKEVVLGSNKLEPGDYSKIIVEVTGVTATDSSGRETDLRVTKNIVELPISLTIKDGQTSYLTITINAKDSIYKDVFTPVLEVQ